MNKRALPIVCACFLLVGMGVQSYVSYSRALFRLQEKMDLEMQIAQEKLRFELFDALDASSQIAEKVKKCLEHPDELYDKTSELLNRYPNFYSCYVVFPPYYYPEKGKWFGLTSYRTKDSIISRPFGNAEHDYFEREWYKGAVQSTEGYWSTPYRDDDFDEPIYTYSKVMRDEEGKLICVIGIDFSLNWIHNLLEQFKPFEEAVFMLYGSNGTLLAMSNGAPADGFGNSWIITSKTLQPINIKMVTAVPKRHIIQSLRLGTLLPFGVFVLGIFVVGLLIRRMTRDERENARLETEKEVLSHELQIAHDIQMGILKGERGKVKGERREGKEDVDLHAVLLPMREVGGDLYDFHRDGDDLWFIIGDVSGKGVPAAIFMSAAVNLFRAAGVRATSPKEIMEEMNAILSENNPSLTFVTAFIGCLHIPTGELLFCNAGHCMPLKVKGERGKVKGERGERKVESLTIEPNIPLGYDGRYCFVEQGCMIGEGDTLVLYTDGVTEARNERGEMLGMEQWKEIIKSGKCEAEDLLGEVKSFIGTGEQADDITLMTIRKTSAVEPLVVRVENKMDHWPVLRCALHDYGVCAGMNARGLKKIELAVEEAVVNIINYSQAEWVELEVKVKSEKRKEDGKRKEINVTLRDNGAAFDPLQQAEVDTDRATDERQVGGMGIHLIRQIVDELHYERKENKNILRMAKSLNC